MYEKTVVFINIAGQFTYDDIKQMTEKMTEKKTEQKK